MNRYKQIDFIIQVLLFVFGIAICFDPHWFFIYSYFIFGGWQLLSVIIHLILNEKFYPANGRKNYHTLLIIVLISAFVIFILFFRSDYNELLLAYFFVISLLTPAMGLWYIFICYVENETLKYKSLVHLK